MSINNINSSYGYNSSPASSADDVNDSIDFKQLVYLCVSHWYWFLISFVVACALGVLYILVTQPVYTRQASLLIRDDQGSMAKDFGFFSEMGLSNSKTNLYNEMITLKSPSYMIDVVRQLGLDINYIQKGPFHDYTLYGKATPFSVKMMDVDEETSASLKVDHLSDNKVRLSEFVLDGEPQPAKSLIATIGTTVQTPIGRVELTNHPDHTGDWNKPIYVYKSSVEGATKAFVGALTVELKEDRSSVIDMTINDASIERAEDILNTLFLVYNNKWIEDINKQAISTSHFIDEELRLIEGELGHVDADISTYKSQNLVPNVDIASNIYMNRSETNNSQLNDLKNELFMANYLRKQLVTDNKHKVLPANAGYNSAVIQQVNAYNEIVLQHHNLIANSSSANPLVHDLEIQLDATKRAIISAVENEIATLNDKITQLTRVASQTQGQIASNPAQAKYLLSVERQQKVKEQLYLFLLQKREENQLSKAFTAYNTKMLNPPDGGKKPSKPVKINVMIIAVLLGFFIPLIILIMIKNLDTKVRNRKDLSSLTIPFIGEIPLSYRKRKGLFALLDKRKEVREIVVKERNGNAINEAFRVIRTNVEFVTGKQDNCSVIMFTSAYAGSGKTFISANLATAFAIKGKKTLMVDLDLRKSSLSSFVNTPQLGIADNLSGNVKDVNDVIIRGSIHPNLDVLPVGSTPPNPTELLYSEEFEILMNSLRDKYDYIFVDCPPLDIVADASIINKICDNTVFVIRSGLFEKSNLPELERNYVEKRYKNMVLLLNGTYDNYDGYGYHSYGYGY